MRPAVSVVIPTLGGHETLRRVLDAFDRQDADRSAFEVVVVVDCADPEPEAVQRLLDGRPYAARMLRGDSPGASANRNAGVRATGAPLVLFTDDDTIPVPGFVSAHLDWHERHPDDEVCVLGLVRWAPEIDVTVFMRWLDTGIQFNFANLEGTELEWGCFVTANVSLKRAFLERVGPFDNERLPYLYEDVDWALRADRAGMRLLFNREAVVDHLRPTTFEDWKRRAANVARAEHRFTRLHPEMQPWFHRVFSHAAAAPRASGRGLRLAPFVPPGMPLLGPRVWGSVDAWYKQQLAPYFLEAWSAAEADEPL